MRVTCDRHLAHLLLWQLFVIWLMSCLFWLRLCNFVLSSLYIVSSRWQLDESQFARMLSPRNSYHRERWEAVCVILIKKAPIGVRPRSWYRDRCYCSSMQEDSDGQSSHLLSQQNIILSITYHKVLRRGTFCLKYKYFSCSYHVVLFSALCISTPISYVCLCMHVCVCSFSVYMFNMYSLNILSWNIIFLS